MASIRVTFFSQARERPNDALHVETKPHIHAWFAGTFSFKMPQSAAS